MRIFIGLLMVFLGTVVTMKSEWLVRNFGYSEFGETKMRTMGGTRLLWKLIGIAAVFGGILVVTDLYGNIILWVFGSLFGGLQQTPGY